MLTSLMDSTQGAYRVTTASSAYLIDLDRMVIRRFPRTGNPDGSLLRRDDELVTLLDISECTVGRRMILLIDLHIIGIPFTLRASTPVIAIEQVRSPGAELNPESLPDGGANDSVALMPTTGIHPNKEGSIDRS